MKTSLIICTYMRPRSLSNLLRTVEKQTKIPDEVIVVDGSLDAKTESMLANNEFNINLSYYKVSKKYRGLTKQRNYGVKKVSTPMEIIAFLDDDIELDKNYFYEINKTYKIHKNAIAIGGVTTNLISWTKSDKNKQSENNYFEKDGWVRRDDIRYRLRKLLKLVTKVQPGKIVSFAHERSIGFLPPSDKVYETDFFMGGIATYKRKVFNFLSFSPFFEGYGLYEDKDFSLRVRKLGEIYVNTNAKVEHHHDPLGRPNCINYGKMVVWNGWRVWRIATPYPSISSKFKWWSITILLTYVRLGNALVGPKRKIALEDFIGRHISMIKLIFTKPFLD